MDTKEIMAKLAAPFPPQDIDWRIGQAGITKGKPWCKVLAYLTARSVMERLDEVVGPENWATEFSAPPNDPEGKSALCTLKLRINNEWIGKSDAAQNSDIEPVKGGISDALKRAAVHWGIGRYLYGLTDTWGQVVEQRQEGAHYANCKVKNNGKEEWASFWWLPPRLPEWAMPPMAEPQPKQPGGTDVGGSDKSGDAVTKKATVLAYIQNMAVIGDAGKVRQRMIELQADGEMTEQETQECEAALIARLAELANQKTKKGGRAA